MNKVIDGLEPVGALRTAEAGMRRCDDAGMLAEKVEEAPPGNEGLEPVEEQELAIPIRDARFRVRSLGLTSAPLQASLRRSPPAVGQASSHVIPAGDNGVDRLTPRGDRLLKIEREDRTAD
jgi:hypothetical protein